MSYPGLTSRSGCLVTVKILFTARSVMLDGEEGRVPSTPFATLSVKHRSFELLCIVMPSRTETSLLVEFDSEPPVGVYTTLSRLFVYCYDACGS